MWKTVLGYRMYCKALNVHLRVHLILLYSHILFTTFAEQPWRLPGDMAHFKRVTTETTVPGTVNAVVMGRKTWDSIPPKFRPLPDRTNIVLTRSTVAPGTYPESVLTASSLQAAMELLEQLPHTGNVFVMGGAQIYEQAIQQGIVNKVIYTAVSNLPPETKFDAFFPELDEAEWEARPYGANTADKENGATAVQTDAKTGMTYSFLEYTRRNRTEPVVEDATATATVAPATITDSAPVNNKEEMQYLDLCREILETGVQRGDRTGTGTLSKFGTQMRFSLRDGTLPLLTTKRTFWRGVAEELLWFVQVRYSYP